MSTDPVYTNHGSSLDPQFLAALIAWEDEGKACPVHFPERLLEHRRFALVMRMTAARFAELDAHERRNYRRWAEHFADVFAEKKRLFTRNSTPEPETPLFLQAKG
jgi:hypothetical protein